jgi:hypothetical protein
MNRKKLAGFAAAIAAGSLLAIGGGGAAQAESGPSLQPLLQLEVPNGGHFFTADLAEEKNAILKHHFLQTVPGTGFVSNMQLKEKTLVPLYRCKATASEAWLLTLDLNEVGANSKYAGQFNCDSVDENGKSEGHPAIVGWVSPKAYPGLVQLERMDNGHDSIVLLKGAEQPWLSHGYHVDGTLGYVYSPKDTDPVPAMELINPTKWQEGAQYTLDGRDADNAITNYGLQIDYLHLGYWRRVKYKEADTQLYRFTVNGKWAAFVTKNPKEVTDNPAFNSRLHLDGTLGWVASKQAPGMIALHRFHMPGADVWALGTDRDLEQARNLNFVDDGVLGYVWDVYPLDQPATTQQPAPTPSQPGLPKTGAGSPAGQPLLWLVAVAVVGVAVSTGWFAARQLRRG